MNIDAARICTSIERRYTKQRGMVFEEINLPGQGHRGLPRRIDALVVTTHGLIAYEVKVTRSDFLAELRDLDKRKPAEAYAVETWFAAPAGLIDPSELPAGWGLLEVASTGRARQKRAAAQRADPKVLPLHVHIQMLRRALATPTPEHLESKHRLPLRFPLEAWSYQGRELTRDDLLELLDQTASESLRHEQATARRQGRAELWEDARSLEPLRQLRTALRAALGLPYTASSAEIVQALQQGTLEARQVESVRRQLQRLHDNLGQLLEAS